MAAVAYAIAFTVTLLKFSPGAGLCNQMPVTEPFWLLYPDSAPPQPGLLLFGDPPITGDPPPEPDPPLPEPPPEPGLLPPPLPVLVFEVEPPHPTMTRTWSATANEQRKERKSRNTPVPTYADVRSGMSSWVLAQIGDIWQRGFFPGLLIFLRTGRWAWSRAAKLTKAGPFDFAR